MQLPSFLSLNKKKILAIIVFFLALSYLGVLLGSIREGVFFSGDGGMKYLIIKQIEAGKGFMYMRLDQPEWVKNIWVNGYFPFHNPFMYPSPGGLLFSFPPYFQLTSAFFYIHFGYWGLYILPAFCTVLFWGCLLLLFRRCGIVLSRATLAIFVLVFCSPLTIYGATYWEHMPAVLLLFAGVSFLAGARASEVGVTGATTRDWGGLAGLLMGVSCGLAVFLRPEALVLNGLYGAAALVLYWKRRGAAYPAFVVGIGVPVLVFFVVNYRLFGSVLGVHSYQVLRDQGMVHEILRGGKNFFLINILSVRYFPFILLLIPVIYRIWKRGLRPELPVLLLIGIVVLFCGLSPFLTPNEGGRQWGARYFLPVIPMVVVILLLLDRQARGEWRWPKWVSVLMVLGIGYAFYLNTIGGGWIELRKGYRERVLPALDYVRKQPEQVIVTQSEYIPMEMATEFNNRYFFWAPTDSGYQRLVPLLKAAGVKQVLYLSEEGRRPVEGKQDVLLKTGNYYYAHDELH